MDRGLELPHILQELITCFRLWLVTLNFTYFFISSYLLNFNLNLNLYLWTFMLYILMDMILLVYNWIWIWQNYTGGNTGLWKSPHTWYPVGEFRSWGRRVNEFDLNPHTGVCRASRWVQSQAWGMTWHWTQIGSMEGMNFRSLALRGKRLWRPFQRKSLILEVKAETIFSPGHMRTHWWLGEVMVESFRGAGASILRPPARDVMAP